VHDLGSVVAPPGFESSLMTRIQADKPAHRFWILERLWLFGFEGFGWRTAAATALAAVCLTGAVYYFGFSGGNPRSAPDMASSDSGIRGLRPAGVEAPAEAQWNRQIPLQNEGVPAGRENSNLSAMRTWGTPILDPADVEYIGIPVSVPGEMPYVVKLPKKIAVRYGYLPRGYFIRYVSH
jgi:hypothetical protein